MHLLAQTLRLREWDASAPPPESAAVRCALRSQFLTTTSPPATVFLLVPLVRATVRERTRSRLRSSVDRSVRLPLVHFRGSPGRRTEDRRESDPAPGGAVAPAATSFSGSGARPPAAAPSSPPRASADPSTCPATAAPASDSPGSQTEALTPASSASPNGQSAPSSALYSRERSAHTSVTQPTVRERSEPDRFATHSRSSRAENSQ